MLNIFSKLKGKIGLRMDVFVLIVILAIGLGVSADMIIRARFRNPPVSEEDYFEQQRLVTDNYKLIAPLLYCDNAGNEPGEYKPLADKLKLKIFDILNNPQVSTVSIYFRDLATGRWLGINEDANYDPASLIKVPVMIAWYIKAEASSSILSQKLYYAGESGDNQGLEFQSLAPKTWYTVDYLIEKMIVDSDNDAKDLLIASLDKSTLNKVFTDLGIQGVGSDLNSNYVISAKDYSLFFRILYNSTYLWRQYSEKALELLSKTSFKDGLLGGLSDGIPVAHKYGVFSPDTSNPNNYSLDELHDCGIVYHPQRPYILCVMTKGSTNLSDLSVLENAIKTVSSITYAEVDNNYK